MVSGKSPASQGILFIAVSAAWLGSAISVHSCILQSVVIVCAVQRRQRNKVEGTDTLCSSLDLQAMNTVVQRGMGQGSKQGDMGAAMDVLVFCYRNRCHYNSRNITIITVCPGHAHFVITCFGNCRRRSLL